MKNLIKVKKSLRGEVLGKVMRDRIRAKAELLAENLVLSASVDHATQRRVEAMGISAFYVKTHVTPGELVQKVSELLKNNNENKD